MATSQPTAGSRIIRFGVFEADLAAGLLYLPFSERTLVRLAYLDLAAPDR